MDFLAARPGIVPEAIRASLGAIGYVALIAECGLLLSLDIGSWLAYATAFGGGHVVFGLLVARWWACLPPAAIGGLSGITLSVAVWVYGDSGFHPVLPLLLLLCAFIPAALATALGVALRKLIAWGGFPEAPTATGSDGDGRPVAAESPPSPVGPSWVDFQRRPKGPQRSS